MPSYGTKPSIQRRNEERTRLDSNQRPSVSKTDALSTEAPGNIGVSEGGEVDVSSTVSSSVQDGDLRALLNAWPTLPDAIKAGIVAMVAAAAPSG